MKILAKLSLCLGVWWTVGCTTTIVPPRHVKNLTAIAVLDHGKHSTLLIQTKENRMVRYAYGDWVYYAEGNTGVFQAIAALFWPTQSGLGRKELLGSVEDENIRRRIGEGTDEILIFHVESDKARALREELEWLFQNAIETKIQNRDYDLEFVHHPQKYWFLLNSNPMLGEWLEKLGCKIEGAALFSSWKIER